MALLPEELQTSTPEDLVRRAADDTSVCKATANELARRPPSEAAAREVAALHDKGGLDSWVAALLFGAIRHEAGYRTARNILLSGSHSASDDYAGVALARIRGRDALPDLVSALLTSTERTTRQGAANGLAELGGNAGEMELVDALVERRIPLKIVSHLVESIEFSESTEIQLLESDDWSQAAVGVQILTAFDSLPAPPPYVTAPSPRLVEAVRRILSQFNDDQLRPAKRVLLSNWLSQVSGRGPHDQASSTS